MDQWELEAAAILASCLVVANTGEFLDRIDRILDEHDRGVLSEIEALWKIRKLRETMTSSNRKLRNLARDDYPPSGATGLFLPWSPP